MSRQSNFGTEHFERSWWFNEAASCWASVTLFKCNNWFCVQSAKQAYKQALGEGIWAEFSEGTRSADVGVPNQKNELFGQLEGQGVLLDVPAEKVTVLFNLARLHEQLHETGKASILYQLILYKVILLLPLRIVSNCTFLYCKMLHIKWRIEARQHWLLYLSVMSFTN